jgi:hypothetical protein
VASCSVLGGDDGIAGELTVGAICGGGDAGWVRRLRVALLDVKYMRHRDVLDGQAPRR